ncbi:MAG: GTPase HflX, partial [Armatimonadota bacterium]|nr:GTPase HflX [Armatimonadota bacterium]
MSKFKQNQNTPAPPRVDDGRVHGRGVTATAARAERAFLLAVDREEPGFEESMDELTELCRTAGAEVVGRKTQKRHSPDPATYIGKGKIEELSADAKEQNIDLIVVDEELSPTQLRNLSQSLEMRVVDRTQLILDIFAHRARTREGKLQVELAQLNYLLPRLAGMWTHLERQRGGIGMRGPGETQIEVDRRHARSESSLTTSNWCLSWVSIRVAPSSVPLVDWVVPR